MKNIILFLSLLFLSILSSYANSGNEWIDRALSAKKKYCQQKSITKDEIRQLRKSVPELFTELIPFLGTGLDSWFFSEGTSAERSAADEKYSKLGLTDKTEFLSEINKIDNLKTDKEKIISYISLYQRLDNLLDVKFQLEYLNPESVKKAYDDFSKSKGYDKGKWQAKMDEFLSLASNIRYRNLNSMSELEKASTLLDLHRQILLSNPYVTDTIIFTRFNVPKEDARSMTGIQLGTQTTNYSSQTSSPRSGFNAELVKLTGIHSSRQNADVLYKATGGGVITDATLHWNADRVMFTGNDSLRRFQVYEINVDGSNFHQVSVTDNPDLEFFDAQYLPSGKYLLCSTIGYQGVPCVNGDDFVGNYSLYDPKTHHLRRLTFDQDNNWCATILNNGKVMYTRWEYTDLTHYYSRIVFTMNPDGTEQRALYGSGSMFPNSTYDMQQLPENNNRFIAIITGHHGVTRAGRLIIFDPTKSRAGAAGMIQELPYSQRPIETLVKDELVDGVWPQFMKPHPLSDKYFIVAAKLSPDALWGIYLVDIYDNVTMITQAEGEGLANPLPIRKRKTPALIPEKIPMDLTNADREATLFIQDLYEGEGLVGVPRGTVKKLRIFAYEYDYLHTPSDHIWQGIQSGWDIKRLLGYVPVEEDGSAIFKIPANTPISIQPVDSLGRAIQWMRSWTVGMPGEIVSCVGCHENQNQIAMPKRTVASGIQPHKIEAPLGGPRAINFEQDIQPILNRACLACHNSEKRVAGIDFTGGKLDTVPYWPLRLGLSFSTSYLQFHPYFYRQGPETEMQVLNPYEYSAYNSEMIQMLKAGHHGVKLSDEEMRTFYLWLDFNAPYHNSALYTPHTAANGEVFDQRSRRRELAVRYSMNPVDWEEEVSNYQKYLDSLPRTEPVMPQKPAPVKQKEIKVRNFPFSADEARKMQTDKTLRTIELAPGVTVDFVWIPSGTYIMGNDKAMSASRKKVTIKKPFWMATTELSNAQIRTMIPSHDSRYIGQHWKDHTTAGYPVNADTLVATKVSYNECMEFCRKLSDKTGFNVTIPTEEQWEWAARAGSDKDFWFGNVNADYSEYENMADFTISDMAVQGMNPQPIPKTSPMFRFLAYIPRDNDVNDHKMIVTSSKNYKPNPWGLYDMNGNVMEWTRSVYYPDPANKGVPEYVVRGGSWYNRAKLSTCSSRKSYLPWIKVWNAGIRLVIED